jgi:hypothetical protein
MNSHEGGIEIHGADKPDVDGASDGDHPESEYEPVIREIVELERQYFFEKRNVKTERQRKLREIIEKRVRPGEGGDDT